MQQVSRNLVKPAKIDRPRYAFVWLDMPFAAGFDYQIDPLSDQAPQTGDWVIVPWGKKRLVGIVESVSDTPSFKPDKIRSLIGVLPDAPRLPAAWFELGRFAATYYHRYPGEVMLPALPKSLRMPPRNIGLPPGSEEVDETATKAKLRARKTKSPFERARSRFQVVDKAVGSAGQPLTLEQDAVLQALTRATGYGVHVLNGITGSGKTEVYLSWVASLLAASPIGQVLMLVPEIALTPQMAQSVQARLDAPMAVLHSGLPEGQRAANWLAAMEGRARVVIGTRLSVLTTLPNLLAVVIDEEHDGSFKQAEGAHYSARDLGIVMARMANVPIVLGSATPALETWHSAQTGRYTLHQLRHRANGSALPNIQIETLREQPRARLSGANQAADPDVVEGLCPASVTAIRDTLARGDQVMVFINRRGYAPVLSCGHCGWLSECDDCSAYRVLHRRPDKHQHRGSPYRLICHHCGSDRSVPANCPACGDVDLQPLGRGTQRVEEILAQAFPTARIARLDRDVARRRGGADEVLNAIHAGEVDIVVGTQMLTKGHDFQRLNLVVVLDADGGLFASDFRAPERLFATLMQVAGRAGRHQVSVSDSEQATSTVIVQTRFTDHPIFAALQAHDYPSFARDQLAERKAAQLPPFSHQALLKVDAPDLDQAIRFLRQARDAALPLPAHISVYDPVPMPMARLAGRGRAQLLVESAARNRLHHFIAEWRQALPASGSRLRWQLEIDPADI
ncbi:MAG: primosomal protein N' [Burkholderiaceae bacterium]